MKRQFKSVLASGLVGANLTFFPVAVRAQIQFTPPPPPDKGAPGQQSDSGTRSPSCNSLDVPSNSEEESLSTRLVAVIPAETRSSQSRLPEIDVWGQTTATHPTFWLYVPPSATLTKEARLIVEDNDDYRSEFRFALPATSGIISLSLPASEMSLASSKLYHWTVKLYCNSPVTLPANFAVDGWIERVELNPTLQQQLNAAVPREKAILYAQQGIWHEMLTELAALRGASSTETADDWSKILQQSGFSGLSEQRILDCCSLEKVDN